jgi:hypothetical protein
MAETAENFLLRMAATQTEAREILGFYIRQDYSSTYTLCPSYICTKIVLPGTQITRHDRVSKAEVQKCRQLMLDKGFINEEIEKIYPKGRTFVRY